MMGKHLEFVKESIMQADSGIAAYVSRLKECFLFWMANFIILICLERREREFSGSLSPKLMNEVHCGGFSGHFAVKGLMQNCRGFIGGQGCIQKCMGTVKVVGACCLLRWGMKNRAPSKIYSSCWSF